MARIRWVPNACFKLYAFKALMKLLWTWISGKNSDLAHLSWKWCGIAHPPVQNEASRLTELDPKRQQLPLCDTSHERNYPASDEDESTRREVPLRGASAIARPTSISVLVALISTAPIFPLLVSPLIVVVIPFLLTVAVSGPLMRTISRTRGPGDIWVLLPRCR